MSTNAWLGVIAWLLAFAIFGMAVVWLTAAVGVIGLLLEAFEWAQKRRGHG